ncbi:MAG: ABC transporter permease, partial [Dehalococcoidia bacterium]
MSVLASSVAGIATVARGRPRPSAPAMVWAPAAVVAAGMLLPLAYLVLRALGAGSEPWDLLLRTRTLHILVRTASLTAAVTASSIAIAVPLAWLTARTDLPLRRLWAVLTVLPLAIPSYVGGFVVVAALGPKGMLQGLLSPLGVERLPEIYGFPGALLTLTLLSYPYALLTVRAALRGLDPALEEASRSLGYGPWRTFRRTTLPHLRPAIAAGGLLVALYTLHDFGAVSLLRYETFTWAIYLQYQ